MALPTQLIIKAMIVFRSVVILIRIVPAGHPFPLVVLVDFVPGNIVMKSKIVPRGMAVIAVDSVNRLDTGYVKCFDQVHYLLIIQNLGPCKFPCECSACDETECFHDTCFCTADHDECVVSTGGTPRMNITVRIRSKKDM